MAGTGNDFIVFDNRSGRFTGEEVDFFSGICRRRISVGADGVILVEKGKSAPVRMRYFNRDGNESTMCGNGARCTGYYAWKKGFVQKNDFMLEAMDGLHRIEVLDDEVALGMVKPNGFRSGYGIIREPELKEGGFIDTGVPHYVIFVKDVDLVDVEKFGVFYRKHEVFPNGANIDFVQLMEDNRIRVRTYERGVEEETLSCGTGCVASALIAAKQADYSSPVKVLTRGGELTVRFEEHWDEVTLTGRVEISYEGTLNASE